MSAEPCIIIAVPESVLNAVEEALHRHLDVMKQHEARDRDRADRISWALAHYRTYRFHEVWRQVQLARLQLEGLSPDTKAEIRSYIDLTMHKMPRSKANAAMYSVQKAELRKEQEAYKARWKALRSGRSV